ncbi:MAG: magnesium/cobalt transporter CorA [Bacteroidetes bacterium]|nr:magnesium/cobalt transporter CorA [Bacteroidota bacterium]
MSSPNRPSTKAGMPPGSLVHIGKKHTEKPVFSWFSYNAANVSQQNPVTVDELLALPRISGEIVWLDMIGVNHVDIIETIGQSFNLHPLVMEDICNTEQRPKFEEFSGYTFFTLKRSEYTHLPSYVSLTQVSIVFSPDFILTFREEASPIFDTIRKRLLSGASRARTKKSDFLVYLIIDSIVDSYFDIVEKISDEIETIEEKMIIDTDGRFVSMFQRLKRNLTYLLKALYPLREALSKLEKRDNPLLEIQTIPYYRDIYDHTVHLIESIENQRDILSGSMDVYLSSLNNRMNSIMKVLTIIATVFIPLSFFASVYGMNFRYFPELQWRYGYLYFWILIIVILIIMMFHFKKKKWM